ncbi:recombinase family protein [Lacrimispora sp. 210928-DFI.3.58]|uniref:recombinase family protein n=1 Tax=Lacrimispora sp. 210928-DFI.3.58 TaxID=2883214 RepID=UPI001D08AAAA|nr:recombinase family protein [Lacrimispora sp. 210928-DFI.3.58]MCB7320915.1 recombinase family protein [Lacrimispora sp. 210928-DFI.3.58]
MENRRKKAWIYTHIDAPEDSHGALKKQYEQLNTYGEQLQTEIAGSSSDMGGTAGLKRPGLDLFLEAKDSRGIEVFLVLDSSRISRDEELCREFLFQMAKNGIEVCSPLEGILSTGLQRAAGS